MGYHARSILTIKVWSIFSPRRSSIWDNDVGLGC